MSYEKAFKEYQEAHTAFWYRPDGLSYTELRALRDTLAKARTALYEAQKVLDQEDTHIRRLQSIIRKAKDEMFGLRCCEPDISAKMAIIIIKTQCEIVQRRTQILQQVES